MHLWLHHSVNPFIIESYILCIHPPIHKFIQSFIHPTTQPNNHPSIRPTNHLSIDSCIHPSNQPSIYPSMHSSLHHCITSIQSCIISFIHSCSPLSADPKWPGWRWWRACWCRRSRNPSIQAQTPNRAQGSWWGACGSRQHRHAVDLWPQQPAWRWPAGSGTLPWSLARRRRTVCRTQRPNRICKIHTSAPKQGQRHSVWESVRDHGIMTSRGLAGLRKLQRAWHSWFFVFNGNSFLRCGEEFRFVRARCEEGV